MEEAPYDTETEIAANSHKSNSDFWEKFWDLQNLKRVCGPNVQAYFANLYIVWNKLQ